MKLWSTQFVRYAADRALKSLGQGVVALMATNQVGITHVSLSHVLATAGTYAVASLATSVVAVTGSTTADPDGFIAVDSTPAPPAEASPENVASVAPSLSVWDAPAAPPAAPSAESTPAPTITVMDTAGRPLAD